MDSFLWAIGALALPFVFLFAVLGCCEGMRHRNEAHHIGYAEYDEHGGFYFLSKKDVCGE